MTRLLWTESPLLRVSPLHGQVPACRSKVGSSLESVNAVLLCVAISLVFRIILCSPVPLALSFFARCETKARSSDMHMRVYVSINLPTCILYVCMYVCKYVCMCVCMYVCLCVCMYACMHACMPGCMYVCMYVCMGVLMGVLMGEWMDGWMDGCMDAWMHGCMDAWMHAQE